MKLKTFIILFVVFLMTFVMLPRVNAASYSVYTVKYKCPVRTGAIETAPTIMNGNDVVNVYPNQELSYLSSATGLNNGNLNSVWYAVKFDYAAREYTGYVASACMYPVQTYIYNDDTDFESKISAFPDSYKPYLRRLHAVHPNWTFTIDNTGLDWNASVTAESQKYQSSISSSYPSLFYRDAENPNGIIVDGTSWYAPCYDAVAYFLDPRNFLTDKNIFMFESLVYNANQDSSVQGVLKGSFMDSEFTENEVTKTYSAAFIEAAKESGVSSIHLASRVLQEIGYTKTAAATGTVAGYEGYYNFYNIGAYSGADNYLKGLAYAKDHGWDGIQKAITGGAKFIGEKYVNNGKDTLYFQKWNVSEKRKSAPYTYEYMTNIMAPSSESGSIYQSYKDNNKLDGAYTFKIPVYNLMTANAYKVSRTDTIGGNDEINEDDPEDNPDEEEKPVVSPEVKVANAGYKITNGFITNIAIGTDISTIRGNLSNAGAVVATLNSSWVSKVSGAIATGDIIEIDGKKKFEVVIYGDIAGDSDISVVDLLYLKKLITGDITIGNAGKKAADVNKDDRVDVVDLLLLKKHIIGDYTISQ